MKELDATDREIINLLINNSRLSMAEIGRRVHLSRVAIRSRVNRLVKENIIQDFTAIVDSNALGYSIHAFFEVEVEPKQLENVAEELSKNSNVTVVYQMTGSTTLHVHAFLRDTEDLSLFLHKHVYTISGVTRVSSNLLLRRFKSMLSIR